MYILYDNRDPEWEFDSTLIDTLEVALATGLKRCDEEENVEISISFVTDEEIKALNKAYRMKDSVTDVLSFPVEFQLPISPKPLGDIVINVSQAKKQAEELGHSLEREFIYLAVHSLLHLLGYDHIEPNEKELMRSREKEIMRDLKLFK